MLKSKIVRKEHDLWHQSFINMWRGGIFRGRVKKKYCCVSEGGHYMKNKNIGECVLLTQPDQQKGHNAKMRKMQKNYQTLKTIFLAPFAHLAFYKIHISGAANRHALVQYVKYVVVVF